MENQKNTRSPFFHLVGSAPFSSSEESFRYFASRASGTIQLLPDGEPGIRKDFCQWQRRIFPPEFLNRWKSIDPASPIRLPGDHELPDLSASEVDQLCKDLHTKYDEHAIESYAVFRRLRDEGAIPHGVRFLVCLPSQIDVIALLWPPYRRLVEPWYEKALLRDLRTLQDAIPHEDLAIQWDCCVPFPILELYHEQEGFIPQAMKPWFPNPPVGIPQRLGRTVGGGAVDADVPMGVHLCYGDLGHKHFVEPNDLKWCVHVGLKMIQSLDDKGRKLSWMHMPVPRERHDPAYFAPLTEAAPLLEHHGTSLVFGLLHPDDAAANRQRLEAARAAGCGNISLGLSSECGLARTSKKDIEAIIEVARSLCQE